MKIFLCICALFFVSCSAGNKRVGLTGVRHSDDSTDPVGPTDFTTMNFDGQWIGTGRVTTRQKKSNRTCPKVNMHFAQSAAQLQVQELGWTCGDLSHNWPQTMIFDIVNGDLFSNTAKFGKIREKQLHIAVRGTNSISDYNLTYVPSKKTMIYREIIHFTNKDTWVVIGTMTKQ